MGNRVSGIELASCAPAANCCVGSDQGGTLVVKSPSSGTRPKLAQSDESSSSIGLDNFVNELGEEKPDIPETSHPVGVNTFDKLTHIHSQIHKQLSKQELLIHQLLRDGEGFDAAFQSPNKQ
eukprot:TRINITY_DN33795_c0_g1_i1.p1 TRINITY_DN33795_c0_g1~~TRINITY_DN33795_c0_g1_i1.p1  ORF type:complete len:132 (+),score=29.25 TRINITY_DN33795_c0_g1_i1:32-397(+)